MSTYAPKFDTTIERRTSTNLVTTVHTKEIDWEYPFHDPSNTGCMCADAAGKAERVERYKEYLRLIVDGLAAGKRVFASNYGGWPRIWQQAHDVGMVSTWPYWRPRPCVLVKSTFGYEWFDWQSLTGAEVREEVPA